MNQLSTDKRAQIVAALVEGCSIRATVRMTGASKNTIAKLLVELGKACANYLDKTLVNLPCKRVQVDELWSYCYAKEKNATPAMWEKVGYAGDVWTFTAIDADSKLLVGWAVGRRDATCATDFLQNVASRLKNRIQLTTDGHKMYLDAVPEVFGKEIDFAMLHKVYGNDPEAQKRYSPAQCIGCEKKPKIGKPKPEHISTSYVERQNLTMRMSMRRYTRLTNAFSKKIDNHITSVAIHVMYYNFVRIHETLRVSPAMQAGVTDRLWSIADIIGLLD